MTTRRSKAFSDPRNVAAYTQRFGMNPAQTERALFIYSELKRTGRISPENIQAMAELYPAVGLAGCRAYANQVMSWPREQRASAFVAYMGFGEADLPQIESLADAVVDTDAAMSLESKAAERDRQVPDSLVPPDTAKKYAEQQKDTVRSALDAALLKHDPQFYRPTNVQHRNNVATALENTARRQYALKHHESDPTNPKPGKTDAEHRRGSVAAAFDGAVLSAEAQSILDVPAEIAPPDDAPAEFDR